uniref:Uncharacterized protein n=1 Tax=Arcella intermedia TaxID=1963864 RepID=A0A6B2LKK6_9EUKA
MRSQLAFYGAYHSDLKNILVHMVFVPVIEWASFGLAMIGSKSVSFLQKPLFTVLGHTFVSDFAFLYSVVTGAFYLRLDPIAGLLRAAWLTGSYLSVKNVVDTQGPEVWKMLLALKIAGWVFQIGAHQIWEGRAPALLDNLVQALVLAPFFVLYEVLFFFGYRPQLRKEVGERVHKLRQDFFKGQEKRRV